MALKTAVAYACVGEEPLSASSLQPAAGSR
jgi:hypothetical protein